MAASPSSCSPSSPSTISIPPQRIALVTSTVNTFIAGFSKPLDSSFTNIYHPDISWYDHAFHVQRRGHAAVQGLQRAWTHCNQPFDTDVKAINPTQRGCVLELVWSGKCANDIVRPNGEVVVKASGKEFKCHVCLVLEIEGENGKIKRIDEYYNRRWDEGVKEEEYVVIEGASLKDA